VITVPLRHGGGEAPYLLGEGILKKNKERGYKIKK